MRSMRVSLFVVYDAVGTRVILFTCRWFRSALAAVLCVRSYESVTSLALTGKLIGGSERCQSSVVCTCPQSPHKTSN